MRRRRWHPSRHLLPRSVRAPFSSISPSFWKRGHDVPRSVLAGLPRFMIAATAVGVNFVDGACDALARRLRQAVSAELGVTGRGC